MDWEKVKNVAGKVGRYIGSEINNAAEKAQKMQQDVEMYMDRYESYSDEDLMQIYRRERGERKIAAGQLLKQRGYGRD